MKLKQFDFPVWFYSSMSEECYWVPTIDCHFVAKSFFRSRIGRALQFEELEHRITMMPTKTRADMAWEEILSNYEMIRLLLKAKEMSKKDRNFCLYIPLYSNLRRSKFPQILKKQIRDLIKASKLLQFYKRQCEPLLEAFSLWILEKAARKLSLGKRVLNEIRRSKIAQYPTIGDICLSLERIIRNMNPDNWGMFTHCILSPKCKEYIPPLTLPDSFQYFNRRCAFRISQRLRKAIERFQNPTYALVEPSDFRDFLKRFNLDIPANMNEYLVPYEVSAEILPDWTCAKTIISSPFDPVRPNGPFFEKIRGQPKVYQACIYQGLASINFVTKNGTIDGFGFRENLSESQRADFIFALRITFLKYILLFAEEPCPFSGVFNQCGDCALANLAGTIDGGFTRILNLDCIVLEGLNGINFQIRRGCSL